VILHFRLPGQVPNWVSWIGLAIIGLILHLAVKTILLGGCIVDTQARQLIHWQGLFFPLCSKVFPFSAIRSVHLSFGLYPHGMRAAYEKDAWFNLAADIDGHCLLLRRERRRDQAIEFGKMLASVFQVELLDYTVQQSSPTTDGDCGRVF
jgi:hypothetical protein